MVTRPVNLIADKLAERISLKDQAMRIVATGLACLLLTCVLTSVLHVGTARAAARLQAVTAQKRVLDQREKYLQATKDRQTREYGEFKWAVEIRDVNRQWRGTLFALGRNTPDGVFLNEVITEKTPKGQGLKLAGTAVSLEQVALFISNLSRSSRFSSVQLESTQAGEINGLPTVGFRCYALVGQGKKR